MSQAAAIETSADVEVRNGAIDALKFVGAIGIVWFHVSAPGSWLGYAGLPMFVTLYVLYLLRNSASRKLGALLKERGRRLLLVWLIWSIIYGLAKVADAVVSGAPLSSEFSWWMLLTGPSIHLWFLPFMFFAGAAITIVARPFQNQLNFWIAADLGFVVVTAGTYYLLQTYKIGIPFGQWLVIVPAALFGLCLAVRKIDLKRTILLVLMNILVLMLALIAEWPPLAIQLFISSSIILVLVHIQVRPTPTLTLMGEISLGIYLIHPLIISLMSRVPFVGNQLWAVLFMTVTLSIVSVIVLKRFRYTRGLL